MSLTRFTLEYRPIVLSAVGLALLIGIAKFLTMPRRADPEFTIRTCQVITRWPGIEAERVEQLVTRPLEEEINLLSEVDLVSSTTTTGLSVIYVELEKYLSPDEVPQMWDRVRAKVDLVKPRLPPGVMAPMVNDEFADTAVMLIALYEKGQIGADGDRAPPSYSLRQLEVVANRVRDKIALVDGVAKAQTHGVRDEVIYLETPRSNWSVIGLSISGLEQALQGRNIVAGGGSIDTAELRVGMQPSGEFDAVEEIESLIAVPGRGKAPVLLRDLGIRVRRGYEDPPRVVARYGNSAGASPTVVISFTMKRGFKVTDIGASVRQLIEDVQTTEKLVPADIAAEIVFDESTFVDNKIGDFTNNVFQAIVIVIGVAYLLAGARAAAVMAAAVPFVMLISIGISASLGIDLEQMSIASLIISLGMLVDNAVVVSDNVRRLQGEGYEHREAVIEGVEQIQYPILMGTLTTVLAFAPLGFFLSGEKAEYVVSIPIVVSVTLLTSWVLALTVTALMAYLLLVPAAPGTVTQTPVEWIARRLRGGADPEPGRTMGDRYAVLAAACLRRKGVVILTAVALLVGAGALPVGSQFFPADDRDYLYVNVWLPQGSSLQATDRTARHVEEIMRELSSTPDGERLARYYTSVGGSGPRFSLGVNPEPSAANFAQIIAQTADPALTADYVDDIRAAARARVPGARVIPRKLGLGPPIDSPIGIRVYGSGFAEPGFADQGLLREQADRLKAVLRANHDTWDVHDTWGELAYQLDLDIDEDRAKLAGVTHASVAESFNAYFSGHYLTTYREGDHKIHVYLRFPPSERGELPDGRSVFVEGTAGKVPLDAVAEIEPAWKSGKIQRRRRNRMVEVRAEVEGDILSNDVLFAILPAVEQLERSLPSGVSLEIAGEFEKTSESSGEMANALSAAVVLIILCLIVQYNSLSKPFVVLASVPLGAIGALFGLWVTGNPLGFMPMLGLVSLAGIVVNTGILYVEFADGLIKEKLGSGDGVAPPGAPALNGLTSEAFYDCLVRAGSMRLLPIVLTVSTTVGGLIPLAVFGGPLWAGMAWLMIFGLLVATVLTLLVLPAIYALFVERFGVQMVKVPEPTS